MNLKQFVIPQLPITKVNTGEVLMTWPTEIRVAFVDFAKETIRMGEGIEMSLDQLQDFCNMIHLSRMRYKKFGDPDRP